MLTPGMSDKYDQNAARYSHVLKDHLCCRVIRSFTQPGSVILGGCGYLKLGDRTIDTAIDLSKLNLDYISETDSGIEIGEITAAFKPSHEPTGPFGAKSIGEVVCNTPAPAVAHAFYKQQLTTFKSYRLPQNQFISLLQKKMNPHDPDPRFTHASGIVKNDIAMVICTGEKTSLESVSCQHHV